MIFLLISYFGFGFSVLAFRFWLFGFDFQFWVTGEIGSFYVIFLAYD